MPPIVVIQGGQYGSEAKGMVAAAICRKRNIAIACRTGAINAGHTVYHEDAAGGSWTACKMQQLPTGWVNPDTKLVLGPGAFIHLPTLLAEVEMIRQRTGEDVRHRLFIDYRAGIHLEESEQLAQGADRHTKIGATGKGCAEAYTRKILMRGYDTKSLFASHPESNDFNLTDTPGMMLAAHKRGESVLLEGTQGTQLDLHLGPYPYTTSRQTTAAAWVAEAGLSPSLRYEIVLVLRTFPIRVAGNSGPLPREISWAELVREWNAKRDDWNQAPLVTEGALQEFEGALTQWGLQRQSPDPLKQHTWTFRERSEHSSALSNLNRDALRYMESNFPTMYEELARVFEFTTVTKKLRRIARYDAFEAARAIRIEQPSWVALTFANYDLPHLWYADEVDEKELQRYVDEYHLTMPDARIRAVGFGPREEHLISVPDLDFVKGEQW